MLKPTGNQRYSTGGEVVLSVHNDGPPIPAAMQKKLFDPLQRGVSGAVHSFNRKNLGLGLYIVCEIFMAHEGVIEVSSIEKTGTTFTVRLPKLTT